MEKSYDEIVRLLNKIGRSADGFVYKGSRSFMPDAVTPVDSPAVWDLISRAMARADDDPLYVVAIGAITNIASAILLEPRITRKLVVVWLGGNPTSFPYAKEFNLSQDVHAANIMLDCGVPFIMIPCLGVASHLLSTVAELEETIAGKNELCDALVELYSAYEKDHFGWAKEIWDVSTIGFLINPDWVPTKLIHAPMLTEHSSWAFDDRRHFIREAYFCSRNPIFKDMFKKLTSL